MFVYRCLAPYFGHGQFESGHRHRHLLAGLLLALFCLTAGLSAHAANTVVRQHDFDAGTISQLEIRAAVGDIRLRAGNGDRIKVRLEIHAQRRGLLRRRSDVSALDLDVSHSDTLLTLSFLEEDAHADWEITLPKPLYLQLRLGVGDIHGELTGGADIKLGVGNVQLRAPAAATAGVEAAAGVGRAQIQGGNGGESRRSVVSERANSRGDGREQVGVRVGVGDIDIDLL